MSNSTLSSTGVAASLLAPADHATTLTNLLYLALPPLLLYKGRSRFWPELLAILGAVWFSMVYHQCRDAYRCPKDYTLEETGRMDLIFAYLAVSAGTSPYIYCFADYRYVNKAVLIASPALRAVFFCVMTMVSFTLLTWTSPNEEYISFGIVGGTNIIALLFCAFQRYRYKSNTIDKTSAGSLSFFQSGAFFILVMAFALFILFLGGLFRILMWSGDIDNYNTYHSLWHACGAVSGFMIYSLLPGDEELKEIEDRGTMYSNLSTNSPSSSSGTEGRGLLMRLWKPSKSKSPLV